MKLKFVTEANDDSSELRLITESKEYEAICKLSEEYSIFSDIENALKIEKYIRQKNVSQLAESTQTIINLKQKEACRLIKEVKEHISDAILHGKFYIDGELKNMSGNNAKSVLDKALETLVEHTYNHISDIEESVSNDADIRAILNGNVGMEGMEANQAACDNVYSYLETKYEQKMPVSMATLQSRYQSIPYGWKEIDIAAIVARLIQAQRVTVKHSGQTIQPNDYHLVDYLRKKSEIGQTNISIRETIPARKMKEVKDILKNYFDVMDIPADEDGLVSYIVEHFKDEKIHLEELKKQNDSAVHPGANEINEALSYVNKVLLAKDDNIALVNTICDLEDDLLDSKDAMRDVENFYASQIKLYDNASKIRLNVITYEKDYLYDIPVVREAVDQITDIIKITDNYRYNRIPQLNDCISIIEEEKSQVVDSKKKELNDLIDSCMIEVKYKADSSVKLKDILASAKDQFDTKKDEINRMSGLVALDAKKNTIINLKDKIIRDMDKVLNQKEVSKHDEPITSKKRKKQVRELQRTVFFGQANLSSAADVDHYLANIKNRLLSYINDDEEIEIK